MARKSHTHSFSSATALTYEPDSPNPRLPVETDAQLRNRLSYLLTAAIQRQVWLFFFDERQRLIEPIMPMNDHPRDPHQLHETEDLGLATFPQVFITRARQVATMIGARSFVVVWERQGGRTLKTDDRAWARAFFEQAAAGEEPRDASDQAAMRALFLLHSTGLRQIHQRNLA